MYSVVFPTMDVQQQSFKEKLVTDADVKQEPIDWEQRNGPKETCESATQILSAERINQTVNDLETKHHSMEENNHQNIINSDNKQELKCSADSELMKREVQSWEMILQRVPTDIHIDIKEEPIDGPKKTFGSATEILSAERIHQNNTTKENNRQNMINGDVKQELKLAADPDLMKTEVQSWEIILQRVPTDIHTDIKQEQVDVDQTDPDDVTTHPHEGRITEESEQLDIKEERDIKNINTQYLLDIGDTVMSKQDRAVPGTSSTDAVRRDHTKIPIKENIKKGKTFQCISCDYQCMHKSHFIEHSMKHTGEKPYKCATCGYQCTRSSSLKRHSLQHSGEKPYKCKLCDFRSTCRSNLKQHNIMHTVEKPYKCKICDYQCARSLQLKRHYMKHTGEKPYVCETCDYQTTNSSNLKLHNMKHTGEKPFKCKTCDYQCTRATDLKLHCMKHTEEKPYKCNTCEYQCKRKNNLKRHCLKHTGDRPYKCKICGYQTTHSHNLKQHNLIHTGEKRYRCKTCDYQTNRSFELKSHCMEHTGEMPYK